MDYCISLSSNFCQVAVIPNIYFFWNMVGDLFTGKLSKISAEEKIDLILEVLIPAAYLRLNKKNSREELRKINSYKREIRNLLKNSDLEEYKKQELEYKLRFCDSLLAEEFSE